MTATTLEREADVKTRFLADVDKHVMTVALNQGVHRHLRFKRSDSSFYWFDILTSPGILTINGDMGSFTFSRLNDMFEFFGYSNINPQYWHEKLTNDGGSMEFSEDLLRQYVVEHFTDTVEEWADDHEDHEDHHPARLWWEIQRYVLDEGRGDVSAHAALELFAYAGYRFYDTWEWELKGYSFRYLWCCWAIVWAIEQYRTLPASQDAALRAARSASQVSTETAIRAKVVLLEDENDRLRTQINRDAKAREEQYGILNAKFEASQLLADQAIKERDRLAATPCFPECGHS